MLRIRRFEEKCAELYSAAQDPRLPAPLHRRGGGRRRASCRRSTPDDAVVATYREHGHALARGIPMRRDHGRDVRQGRRAAAAAAAARCTSSTPRRRFYGGNAIVGGGLPLAVGLALADKMQGRAGVTACFFGEGAVAEGEFHESLNLAALWRLPVLFCCENNLYAMGTALARSRVGDRPRAARRAATRCRPRPVDGMDVARRRGARRAAPSTAIRAGGGPHFLELRTYRFRAHSMYDPELYRDKAEVERVEAARPDRRASSRGCGDAVLLTTRTWPASKPRSPPRSTRRRLRRSRAPGSRSRT